MLVNFHSSAGAEFTMLGDMALSLIKMMGHSGDVPGALMADEIPRALANLHAALERQEPQFAGGDVDEDNPRIGLKVRALPLITLLEAAQKAECAVMWDV